MLNWVFLVPKLSVVKEGNDNDVNDVQSLKQLANTVPHLIIFNLGIYTLVNDEQPSKQPFIVFAVLVVPENVVKFGILTVVKLEHPAKQLYIPIFSIVVNFGNDAVVKDVHP